MAQRKFECLKCHHRFEADDQKEVRCPQCQSDNVEYARFRIPNRVWKWMAATIIVLGLIAVLCTTGTCSGEQAASDTDSIQVGDIIIVEKDTPIIDIIDIPDVITEKPTISSSDLKYEDGGYVFSVKINHAPKRPYYVCVLEHISSKEIVRSEDGEHFSKVPPSTNEEGIYDLAIFDSETGTMLNSISKTGFTPPVSQRMTKEQLQQLINNDDESLYGIHKQISSDCKLHFTGLPADAQKPETLADVMIKLGQMWKSATVTHVDYDTENRINDITFAVQTNN